MKSDPYEPPKNDSEVEEARDFVPKSDWFIRLIFLAPTLLYIPGVLVLKIVLSLNKLNFG